MKIKNFKKTMKISLNYDVKDIYKDKRYKAALSNYEEQYEKIKSYFPAGCGFKILDGLDKASIELSRLEKEYFYKKGIKDILTMLKQNSI